ncbi:MAG: holo-ACP synthase [Cyanomargarita calcarea GSE-NOS-MK-12-04C]|jgi:holo-[acyl-carrier protein] synthase|uniref:Holo-[acyl-carrier-protein] synthase n=1 Tax=Cyanomargarita calcarea GSE-NOS-MK-12-04C TaxID=2839659 RepID=A0A951UT60_9CYAN|nr:holo-ACP synthase [Cyanomargarita calcarea GSE-NOS-MK-12-04C]
MIRLGTDIVYIPRIKAIVERFGDRFLQRVYTPTEQENCGCDHKHGFIPSIGQLAGRWAAKEAVVKALGTGWRGIGYTDVEIRRHKSGAPFAILHNEAKAIVTALARGEGASEQEKEAFGLSSLLYSRSSTEANVGSVPSPQWQLSLSHDGDYAIATAILICPFVHG